MRKTFPLLIFLMFFSAQNTMSQENSPGSHPDIHKIEIKEVIQTTSYTYLFVKQEEKSLWMAIPKMEAGVGEIYYYYGGMEMRDFKSKELNRIFESILFLNGIVHPDIVEGKATENPGKAVKKETETEIINIQPPDGGISISELIKNKKQLEGTTVRIKARVVKYNSGILQKNWVHLNDGSCDNGKCDLTVTTVDETKIGEIITVEGKVTLDKNFGAGYFYSLIIEEGKILK